MSRRAGGELFFSLDACVCDYQHLKNAVTTSRLALPDDHTLSVCYLGAMDSETSVQLMVCRDTFGWSRQEMRRPDDHVPETQIHDYAYGIAPLDARDLGHLQDCDQCSDAWWKARIQANHDADGDVKKCA
jgi:hypothetical protein